ncbi:hypothetical protein C8J57DRAFT_1234754 [Mycena rebaudengoi]|nr:hypothetical protein C8J57DRAFT_1234754 [Mycena rebaudengoi]
MFQYHDCDGPPGGCTPRLYQRCPISTIANATHSPVQSDSGFSSSSSHGHGGSWHSTASSNLSTSSFVASYSASPPHSTQHSTYSHSTHGSTHDEQQYKREEVVATAGAAGRGRDEGVDERKRLGVHAAHRAELACRGGGIWPPKKTAASFGRSSARQKAGGSAASAPPKIGQFWRSVRCTHIRFNCRVVGLAAS